MYLDIFEIRLDLLALKTGLVVLVTHLGEKELVDPDVFYFWYLYAQIPVKLPLRTFRSSAVSIRMSPRTGATMESLKTSFVFRF